MKRVLKYRASAPFDMPVVIHYMAPGKIVHATFEMDYSRRLQHVVVWSETDIEPKVTKTRAFKVIGTGHKIKKEAEHILSCFDRIFVWHLYEIPVDADVLSEEYTDA